MTLLTNPKAIFIFDIDGVLRDVGGSYRRALADTVEQFTGGGYRPSEEDIDNLKSEGIWNNDWEGSQELIYRYFERQGCSRSEISLSYDQLVEFFQARYRGPNQADPDQWTGYITQEPLLAGSSYFAALTAQQTVWGFFSGATRGSASYVLERRLGLTAPTLVAMEDAPGKPDPTGLLLVVEQITQQHTLPNNLPVVYAGDTVADMQTVIAAQRQHPHRPWVGVGVLPPHVLIRAEDYAARYRTALIAAGAKVVVDAVTGLTTEYFESLSPA